MVEKIEFLFNQKSKMKILMDPLVPDGRLHLRVKSSGWLIVVCSENTENGCTTQNCAKFAIFLCLCVVLTISQHTEL